MSFVACVALLAVGAAYALLGMEWLFFVTKPSFLSFFPVTQKLVILAVAPLPVVGLAVVTSVLLAWVAHRIPEAGARRVLRIAATLPSAALLGSLCLLLIDNFTTTVLHTGMLKSGGALRWLFGFVCLTAYAGGTWIALRLQSAVRPRQLLGWLALVAVTASGLTAIVTHRSPPRFAAPVADAGAPRRPLPDIVLLSGDGIDAAHMSCYGYERDTTPFLASVAEQALVCKNAFSNCAHTSGSIASLLTGRLPTETRVVYPPDVLTGDDVYRHLPAILRHAGYATLHVSIRHYADAFDLNLRDGFQRSTFRDESRALTRLSDWLGDQPMFFLDQVGDRVRLRLLHLLGGQHLPDSYTEVGGRRIQVFADSLRVAELFHFAGQSEKPFFAHIHLMGTHGPRFHPRTHRFAAGQAQPTEWMTDFYDDAIHDFDGWVAEAMRGLTAPNRERSKNTIVVVLSDHGMAFTSRVRIPLLFFFPEGAHAGRLRGNVQLVDVAPTLLDYLGLEIPRWMSGISLLRGEPDPRRPIFSASRTSSPAGLGGRKLHLGLAPPPLPFLSMGSTTMIVCDRVYTCDWEAQALQVEEVEEVEEVEGLHSGAVHCNGMDAMPGELAASRIVEHLRQRGFNTTSLPRPFRTLP